MRTIKLSIAIVAIAFCTVGFAQQKVPVKSIIRKETAKKPVKSGATAIGKINPASRRIIPIKKAEDMCKPLDIRGIEAILRDRVGRTLKVQLDKDYGFIEIMGKRKNINFGEYKVNKVGNDWTYTLNDIKSKITRIQFQRDVYIMTIEFESDDSEIKGRCPGCRIGKDNRAPDINWKDPGLYILLKPVAYKDSFTFEVQRVNLRGDFDFNGHMDKFLPTITAFFKRKMEDTFRNHMQQTFGSTDVKKMLASAFKPEVDKLGLDQVKNVDMSDNKIYLCNY